MKRIVNKLIRDEKGQVLVLAVILLLVGSLIIVPLLGFMSTGLIAGQVFEKKMDGLYAADAGIEDALWKLLNGSYSPPHTLTDVNGMDVTVIQLGDPVDPGDGTLLYTLQSTAYLGGEVKAEIIAQVEAVTEGAVAAGGEGGEYKTNEETVALSLINEDSIIFTTQNKSIFWGREEDILGPGTDIEPEDLGLVNMVTGTGTLYLDGDALGLLNNPKYGINGVHYYQEGGSDYLLMTIKTTAQVGTETFNNNDIIKLPVTLDISDPVHPFVNWVDVDNIVSLYTIPGVDLVALSQRDDGTILFSISNLSTTLPTIDNPNEQFYRGEIIEFDGQCYKHLFNANDIIPDNPNLVLDVLAVLPAPDERLLLSFTVDGVTGSNGVEMGAEDIAIWGPGPDGILKTSDDTINLHISMSGRLWPADAATVVNIVSWEIN